MNVPAFLFGQFKDVRARCSKTVTQLVRGRPWSEVAADGEMLDTAAVPFVAGNPPSGLLVMDGPSSLLGDAEHVHIFALPRAVGEAVSKGRLSVELKETLVAEWVATAWGTLSLLTPQYGANLLIDTSPGVSLQQAYQHPAFLRAVLRFWGELAAEGKRYSHGSRGDHRELWNIPTSIGPILGQGYGFSNEELRAPNWPAPRQSGDDLLRMIRLALDREPRLEP